MAVTLRPQVPVLPLRILAWDRHGHVFTLAQFDDPILAEKAYGKLIAEPTEYAAVDLVRWMTHAEESNG